MKSKLLYIIYWAAIFTVSIMMFIYGIMKPSQFMNMDHSIKNIHLSEGHRLMWCFYSYTKTYPIIIGVFEILGAITLLFRRTRISACILLSTILFNIILQDYFYEITALNVSIYLQLLILVILLIDYKRVKEIIKKLFENHPAEKPNSILIGIGFIIAIIIYLLFNKIM